MQPTSLIHSSHRDVDSVSRFSSVPDTDQARRVMTLFRDLTSEQLGHWERWDAEPLSGCRMWCEESTKLSQQFLSLIQNLIKKTGVNDDEIGDLETRYRALKNAHQARPPIESRPEGSRVAVEEVPVQNDELAIGLDCRDPLAQLPEPPHDASMPSVSATDQRWFVRLFHGFKTACTMLQNWIWGGLSRLAAILFRSES